MVISVYTYTYTDNILADIAQYSIFAINSC